MNIVNAILVLHSIELFDSASVPCPLSKPSPVVDNYHSLLKAGVALLGNGLGLCTASDVIFAEYCVSW